MDTITNWLDQIRTEPLTAWIGVSILACTLISAVAWQLRGRVQGRMGWSWLVQVARFVFYLGIPYLALGGWPRPPFSGLLSLDDLGFAGLNPSWPAARWLGAAGAGLALGLGTFVVLLLAWRSAGRPRAHARPAWALLLDGLYLQVHWAFYRGALGAALDDPYVGAWLGLGLVCVEWALNPFWRSGWGEPYRAPEQWLRAALALLSVPLFLLTRNLWVSLAVHWAIEIAFAQLGRERTAV